MLPQLTSSISARMDGSLSFRKATLSTPDSKWRVVSGLQKAIRRGDVDQTLLTASALYKHDPQYLLRRLCVIAIEDIALGDVDLVAEVFGYCGYSAVRSALSEEALLYLLKAMAECPKDRSACELATRAIYSPKTKPEIMQLISKTPEQNLEIALSDNSVILRTLARLSLGGILSDGAPRQTAVYGERNTKMWHTSQEGMTPSLDFISRKSMSFGGDLVLLVSAMRVVWEEENNKVPEWIFGNIELDPPPSATIVKGILSTSYDVHCHQGKRAIAYFLKACKPVREFFNENPTDSPNQCLGDALFEVEGKWCKSRVWSEWGQDNDELSVVSDAEAHGYSPETFYALMFLVATHLDELNVARARVMES